MHSRRHPCRLDAASFWFSVSMVISRTVFPARSTSRTSFTSPRVPFTVVEERYEISISMSPFGQKLNPLDQINRRALVEIGPDDVALQIRGIRLDHVGRDNRIPNLDSRLRRSHRSEWKPAPSALAVEFLSCTCGQRRYTLRRCRARRWLACDRASCPSFRRPALSPGRHWRRWAPARCSGHSLVVFPNSTDTLPDEGRLIVYAATSGLPVASGHDTWPAGTMAATAVA